MKRITHIILLFSALCPAIVSCEDDASPTDGHPVVEIRLQAEDDSRSVSGAEVTLNYRTEYGSGKVLAEKKSDGCYGALLPSRCVPASDFIEVRLDGDTYGYSPSETAFEVGHLYNYSLVLTSDGLQEAGGMNATINGWVDGGSNEGVAL